MALKIFYLDDEPDLGELFVDTFSTADIIVRSFVDPAIAIDAIQKERPDLVFLDYRLPNTTGDAVALKLGPDVPKALMTGDIIVETQANFLKVFAKPFNTDEISAFIETFAGSKQNTLRKSG